MMYDDRYSLMETQVGCMSLAVTSNLQIKQNKNFPKIEFFRSFSLMTTYSFRYVIKKKSQGENWEKRRKNYPV